MYCTHLRSRRLHVPDRLEVPLQAHHEAPNFLAPDLVLLCQADQIRALVGTRLPHLLLQQNSYSRLCHLRMLLIRIYPLFRITAIFNAIKRTERQGNQFLRFLVVGQAAATGTISCGSSGAKGIVGLSTVFWDFW
jgi:hypothetical protein